MFAINALARRLVTAAAALAITASGIPVAASAQDVPSYAQPAYASADETIHGRIRSVEGAFTISVDDDRGFIDNIQLHQGTIINPTGLTLSPGMSVTILGANAGSAFSANEIDTPYTYAGPLPTPVYYGAGYWCPGFAYGYGPSFSLAIIIGGGSRPWYYEHRPYYGRPWNGHGYFGSSIAWAPQAHDRADVRRAYTSPTIRRDQSDPRPDVRGDVRRPNAGAPPAFAGRSFAGESRGGESRVDPDRFGTESTARPAVRTVPAEMRAGYSRENQARSAGPSESFSRSAAPAAGVPSAGARDGGYQRAGGSMRAEGSPRGGGASRAEGGGHGGGHAH